jgi:serine/threonine protein phosphatase PrpC
MGGHRDGHVASNSVVSILSRTLVPDATFEDRIDSATHALSSVNATLYEQGRNQAEADISGSTVVSLIVGETYACCLWVGDSRLYLLRDGDLYLLSRDHAAFNGTLTRAVGSSANLDIERRIIEIEAGDVFLLCSDGLLKGIEEHEITAMLAQPGEAPADRLLAKSVAGGSLDDITLVLVWVLGNGA